MIYDLKERVLLFSKQLLRYIKTVYITDINKNIVNQVLRSGTSIGANYCEANGASSKRDFANKIYICKKESKETAYWLELLSEITNTASAQLENIIKESKEIARIFNKIAQSFKNKSPQNPVTSKL
ncbi:MAG: four helix bundle protein [candidate division SR1 bacterium]|nr:four helix bundle protein [candidate division SR1 bacterium]